MSGALCGALLLRPGDADGPRYRRALSLPNPQYLAWKRHGKGKEPPHEVSACGVMDGGPWKGGTWVPRRAEGVQGAVRTVAPPAAPLEFLWRLRGYQQAAADAVVEAGGGIVEAPCGAGKTVIGCSLMARYDTPCLVLVHTRDLAMQWVARIRDSLGIEAGLVGYGKRKKGEPGGDARVVVASLQTLARFGWWAVHEFGLRFGLVIADECFPAGTPISMGDGTTRPIEAIRPGDSVLAWLDGEIVCRDVVCTSSTSAQHGARVHVGGLSVTCTLEHPFLTARGWVKAQDLRSGDMVLLQEQEENHAPIEAMANPSVHVVRRTCGASEQEPEGSFQARGNGVLQPRVLQRLPGEGQFSDDGRNEPEARVGTDAQAKPNEAPGGSAARVSGAPGHRAQASSAGGQWTRAHGASSAAAGGAGGRVGGGVRRENQAAAGQRGVSASVQGGHRGPIKEDRGRGRREFAQHGREPEEGRQKGWPSAVAGVDGHPGFEWRRVVRCERVRIDDRVYNFSVDEAETYVAGGIVVHNCHHVPASTWGAVMAGLSARVRVGLTATPERADGLTPILGWHLGPTVARIDPQVLEDNGSVLAPRIQRWRAPEIDLDGLESHERDRALAEHEARNAGICIEARVLVEGGGRVLLLVKLVDHAYTLAAMLCAAGVDAAALVGEIKPAERAELVERMRAGTVEVVVATSLADEGLDAPRLDSLIMAAPSGNLGRVEQRIGRVCRPHEDGLDPVVVDVVDSFGPFQGYARRRAGLYSARGWM